MAEEVTTVTVKHGGASHHIKVAAGPDHNEPTLGDMVSVLTQVTGVPPTSQKLVFKGKSLKEMDQTLSALGITDGCKIMLIGKKNCPEEEAELKKLKDIEKTLEQVSKKLQELDSELSGIQKVNLVPSASLLKLLGPVRLVEVWFLNNPGGKEFIRKHCHFHTQKYGQYRIFTGGSSSALSGHWTEYLYHLSHHQKMLQMLIRRIFATVYS
ncbi:BAG family molecular chaperone regulator 1 [Protopterus annectens]|uniref:BAG family molecular chaperone regulator 1 n=1 Tax=Protopterus annectens TaxID=7888 RepID=UPI001CF9EEF1|nr:BAG family molecular chaperone regulator 1 [Protopterus annectens]